MKTFSLNKIALAIAMTFVGTLSTQAFAQTDEVRNSKMFKHSVNSNKALVNIGEPSGNLDPLKGFAKDLPLITVLKQITPNGWVVKKNDSETNKLDVQQLVSWTGGKSWVETLGGIASENNLTVLVHWENKEIIVAPNSNVASLPQVVKKEEFTIVQPTKSSGAIFELAGTETNEIATGGSNANEVKAHKDIHVEIAQPIKVEPVRPAYAWKIDSNISLKENVEQWGKKVGYKVVWNGFDYPIDQGDNRVFGGEFDANNGPIQQLSVDYGPKSRVQQPLTFQFFQNSTLVVDDWKFEQQGFPQYTQE